MASREEMIKKLRRRDMIQKLRNRDEQQGMAQATLAADKGGAQEGIAPDPTLGESVSAFSRGIDTGTTAGAADYIRAGAEAVSPLQLIPGFESKTFEEALKGQQDKTRDIADKAPTADMVGQGVGLAASFASPVKAGAVKAGQTAKAVGTSAIKAGKAASAKAGSLGTMAKILIDIKLTGGVGTVTKYGKQAAEKLIKKAVDAEKKGLPDKIKKEVADGIKDAASIRKKDIFNKATKTTSKAKKDVVKDPTSPYKKDIFGNRAKPTKGMKHYKGD